MQDILVFAHRGASAEFPENTLYAFKRAVEIGADYLETDIHFTKDKKFAVIHDDLIDRTTDGSGLVSDYTMAELQKFDAGYNFTQDGGKTYPFRGAGLTIMSLDELLAEFPDQRFNIDLKDKTRSQINYFSALISGYRAESRIIAASEHYCNLRAIRKMCPDVRTSFSAIETLLLYFLFKCGLLFINPPFKGNVLQVPENWGQFRLVTSAFIREVHNIGIDIHIWTVNKEKDMRRFIEIGIDGIISDDPGIALKVLSEMK